MTIKKHYAAVILVHPDHVSNLPETIKRYEEFLSKDGGVVHRSEDWGKKTLAYSINDVRKANYLLFNFEVSVKALEDFKKFLEFNDAVIRMLIMRVKGPQTAETAMSVIAKDEKANMKQIASKFPKDFMNIPWMKANLTELGSIMPARNTELSASVQRALSHSVKVARYLALIPYCDRHV